MATIDRSIVGSSDGRRQGAVRTIHLRNSPGGKKSGVSAGWARGKVVGSHVYGGGAQVFLRVYVFYALKSTLLSRLLYAGDTETPLRAPKLIPSFYYLYVFL